LLDFIVEEIAMKDKLLIWLIGVGLAIAYIGVKFRNPILIGLLVAGLGLFSIFSGLQMIIFKRAEVPTSDTLSAHKERYTGLAAQLYGILFIAFGVFIILIALGEWLFHRSAVFQINQLLGNSFGFGVFLTIAGALILIYGIIRLIVGNAAYTETGLRPFERVAGGIYFSLFGLGVLATGMWLIVSPFTLSALIKYWVSLIGKLIPG